MATLNNMTPESKKLALGGVKNSLETQIVMSLIQMGFEDPFNVDIDTADFSGVDASFMGLLERCRTQYANVCTLLSELE